MAISPCANPWFYLSGFPDGSYTPCCFLHFKAPMDAPNLMAVEGVRARFNSTEMKSLRSRLIRGDLSGLPCESCIASNRQISTLPEVPPLTDPRYAELWERIEASYHAGELSLSYLPLVFSILLTTRCNIDCVMCVLGDKETRDNPTHEVSGEALIELVREVGYQGMAIVKLSGGEPLYMKQTKAVLDYFAEYRCGPRLGMYTNGVLLHKYLPMLEKLEGLDFWISVDGYGDAYEIIRRKAKWSVVEENLRLIAQARDRHPGWRVSINSVIMRSSIESFPKLIELASSLGIDVGISGISGEYWDENVFLFPDLLEKLSWREALGESQRIAQRYGNDLLIDRLVRLRADLEGENDGERRRGILLSDSEMQNMARRIAELQLVGKRVVAWGVDRRLISLMSAGIFDDLDIQGIVDDGGRHEGRWFGGVEICPPEMVMDRAEEVLLFAVGDWAQRATNLISTRWPHIQVHDLNALAQFEIDSANRLAVSLAGRDVVVYGAGEMFKELMSRTRIGSICVKAVADSNMAIWGKAVEGVPVVAPGRISCYGTDVLIASRGSRDAIAESIRELYGSSLRVYSVV